MKQRYVESDNESSCLIRDSARNELQFSSQNGRPSHNGATMHTTTLHRRVLSFAETVEPLTLTWKNLSVNLRNHSKLNRLTNHPLLDRVSGCAMPGNLYAIMGPSGSGKTVLLNALNSKILDDNLQVEGDILVNGEPLSKGIKAVSAYVHQTEIFVPNLKVREHLWFHAQLRMDSNISVADRLLRIEEVLVELSLKKCADTQIGARDSTKGISGGEMKRLCFASELLTNPPLFFCDEPTSGLDTFMVENVVNTLKAMANKGKTVICTIQQPSSIVYNLFDKLMLLCAGRVAYSGDAAGTKAFFEQLGYSVPINYNPADHFIRCLAMIPHETEESEKRRQQICNAFQTSKENAVIMKMVDDISMKTNNQLNSKINIFNHNVRLPYKATWWIQFSVLLWRCWLVQIRNMNIVIARLLQSLVLGAMLGIVYWQQQYDQHSVTNISALLYIFVWNQSGLNLLMVVTTFTADRKLFLHEHRKGMYRVDAYYLAKNIADFPIISLASVFILCYSYWMIGLYPQADAFFLTIAGSILLTQCSVSLGYWLSAILKDVQLILSVVPLVLRPLSQFAGFMLDVQTLPVWIVWIKYISWYFYGYEFLMVVQWLPVANITCDGGTKCLNSGLEVLNVYGMNPNGLLQDTFAIVLLIIGFRFLGLIVLHYRAMHKAVH